MLVNFSQQNNFNFKASLNPPKTTFFKQADNVTYAYNEIKPLIEEISKKKKNDFFKNFLDFFNNISLDKIYHNGLSYTENSKKYSFFYDNIQKILKLEELDKINSDNSKFVEIKDLEIINSKGFSTNEEKNNFANKMIDNFDFIILKLRIFLNKIKLEKTENTENTKIKKGILTDENITLSEEIKSLFIQSYDNLHTIKNAANRCIMKNKYPLMKKNPKHTREIIFDGSKFMDGNFSINVLNAPIEKHLILRFFDNKTGRQNIIVSPQGIVYKQKKIKGEDFDKVEYYTQEELDNGNIKEKLISVKEIMTDYNNYILEKIKIRNKNKKFYNTDKIGIIDDKLLEKIGNIETDCRQIKTKLASIKDKKYKDRFKDKYNVDLRKGSSGLILQNINLNNESAQISFPVIDDKKYSKILILDKDNDIKTTFFIEENRLVKFEASNLSDSKQKQRKKHYYSPKDIDNLRLELYMNIISRKLNNIVEDIKIKQ